MIKKIVLLWVLVVCSFSYTFVELFGMEELLAGMAKMTPTKDYLGQKTITYMLDPNIHSFLRQFNNRTEFCEYKCRGFFDLPCFLLFGCNIQIRNFFLLFFTPIVILLITSLCCGRGIWTFRCWVKYLMIFSGISLIMWVIRKCVGS